MKMDGFDRSCLKALRKTRKHDIFKILLRAEGSFVKILGYLMELLMIKKPIQRVLLSIVPI